MNLRYGIVLAAIVALANKPTNGMTVYDCHGLGKATHALSLLQPEECPDPLTTYMEPVERHVEVFQVDPRVRIDGLRCRVVMTSTTWWCGSFHRVFGGPVTTAWEATMPVGEEECRNIWKKGAPLQFERGTATKSWNPNLDLNKGRYQQSDTFFTHGYVTPDGNCYEPGSFQGFNEQYYRYHVEEVKLKITVERVQGSVDTTSGRTTFLKTQAMMDAGYLQDGIEGTVVWEPQMPTCNDKIGKVYAGSALVHYMRNHTDSRGSQLMSNSIVTISQEGHSGGFALRSRESLCGQRSCYATHLPDLKVCLTDGFPRRPEEETPFLAGSKEMLRLRVLTVISRGHFGTNLEFQKHFVTVQSLICEVERRTLANTLADVANGNPYSLLEEYGRGHAVYRAGSVAYIAKCQEREALTRSHTNCTMEIPVVLGSGDNATLAFADSLTRVLRPSGTVVPCDSLMPIRHQIGGNWYCATPGMQLCGDNVRQLKPRSANNQLEFRDFTAEVTDGIFNPEQVAEHDRFLDAMENRDPAQQHITNGANSNLGANGEIVNPLGSVDMKDLTAKVGGSLIAWVNIFGTDIWYYLINIGLAVTIISKLVAFLWRFCTMYEREGNGLVDPGHHQPHPIRHRQHALGDPQSHGPPHQVRRRPGQCLRHCRPRTEVKAGDPNNDTEAQGGSRRGRTEQRRR